MSNFPEQMQINPATRVSIAIPSWHINGHRQRCRRDFYLGYTRGAGRTCGEEVETTWSSTNALGPSMREMASFLSLKTHYLIGTLFSKCFQEVVLMSAKHMEIFEKFSATFPPETVRRWVQMVERWENDPKAPNLYNETEQSKCLSLNIYNY